MTKTLTHLDRLEAESIHIMREVVAEADKPVMLYSVGKDSAVMLHLARKAFYPSPPPFTTCTRSRLAPIGSFKALMMNFGAPLPGLRSAPIGTPRV